MTLLIYSYIFVSAVIQDNAATYILGQTDTCVRREFTSFDSFGYIFSFYCDCTLFCSFLFATSCHLLILHTFHQMMAALPFSACLPCPTECKGVNERHRGALSPPHNSWLSRLSNCHLSIEHLAFSPSCRHTLLCVAI